MRYDYEYYPDYQLKAKKASVRTLLAYTYDLNGNKIAQMDLTGKITHYTYNLLDELIQIDDEGNQLASYQYYSDGSIKSLTQSNGLETFYQYDQDKNMSHLDVYLAGEKIVQNGYTYDSNGNRIEKQQLNGTTTYTYDVLNQLTKVNYPHSSETLYYDKAGNRTKRITDSLEEHYTYDVRNRLVERHIYNETHHQMVTYNYDAQGNLLQDEQAKYHYDGFNRLEKIERFDVQIQVNHYDAEGLRYEIEENHQLVQFLFNDKKEVVVEQTTNDTLKTHTRI